MKLGNRLNIRTTKVGSEFTPANLSNLLAWYKFDTGMSNTTGGSPIEGDDIVTWRDQSGNDNHLTAPNNYFVYEASTGSAVSVNGSDDKFHMTTQLNLEQFSLYMRVNVSAHDGGATDLLFLDKDTSTTDFFRIQSATEVRCKISGAAAIKWGTSTLDTAVFTNYGFERDSSNDVRAYSNGSALTASTAINTTGVLDLDAIGTNFDGKIKEVVITSSSLSSADRTNLQAYLANLTQGE